MKANLEPAAAAKRKRVALGKEHSDAALGREAQNTSDPEGAKEGGELPEGWRWVTLRGVADIAGGVTKGQKRRSNETIRRVPYLRVANVQRGYLDLSEVKEIDASETEIESLRLEPGDILFNEGGDRDKLGRGWVWNGELPEWVHQNHVFRARLRDSADNAKFVSYYGNSAGQRYFYDQGKHTTNLASINLTKLGALPIPLPPPDEQHQIVAEIEKQFTRLEAGVAALQRVQANLKRYRAAVLKAACEGRLVPTEAELVKTGKRKEKFESGEELLAHILAERRRNWQGRGKYKEPATLDSASLPLLPEGWTYASVEQLGIVGEQAVLTGPFGTNLGREDFTDSGVPMLTISCLKDTGIHLEKADFVSEEKAHELGRYRLVPGDLLFSRMASVGRAGIIGEALRGTLFNYHIMRLRLEPTVLQAKFYLAYVRGSAQVEEYLREVNHGATRAGINTEQLLNMPVALHPSPNKPASSPKWSGG